MKILLIDDEAFALKLLIHQLAGLGFRDVTPVTGGTEALALIAEGVRFDTILTALQMPGMDGVEFVRALTQSGYGGELVLVSGEDENILKTAEQLARAHGLRVLGRLKKPVALERLAKVLAQHTDAVASRPRTDGKCYGPDELRQAIAAGELVCHCQPKVSLATGAPTGVEILVRWQHPVDGLVFPDRFIAVAEEHSLIDDLTRSVLRDALRQMRTWFDAGREMHVAVNVSMDNLGNLDFPDFVVAVLDPLDMRSVAEGVEDGDDWNFLRAHGCDIAQGYFIARPMPMAALADWLPEWERRRGELGLIRP